MKQIATKAASKIACVFALLCMQSIVNLVSAADEYTVELYDTYCKACHSVAAAGAPVAFNKRHWGDRMEKGIDNLVNNAVNGIGNMPAQGSCQECTYEDFEDLISYMSTERQVTQLNNNVE